jgi:putative transposase
MDGRGRVLDNAFIERLWRTVKYEEIYLNHYDSVWELEDRLTAWFDFYCNRRRHSALNYCCLAELFFGWAVAGKESLQRA